MSKSQSAIHCPIERPLKQQRRIFYDEDDSTIYFGDNNYFTEVTQEDLLSEYEVRISPMIIAEIYVLGIGVVFVSIVIPSLMIMRFNPKKILMNQN